MRARGARAAVRRARTAARPPRRRPGRRLLRPCGDRRSRRRRAAARARRRSPPTRPRSPASSRESRRPRPAPPRVARGPAPRASRRTRGGSRARRSPTRTRSSGASASARTARPRRCSRPRSTGSTRRSPARATLVARYDAWRRSQIVPAEAMLDVFAALREIFRTATAAARSGFRPTRRSRRSSSATSRGSPTTTTSAAAAAASRSTSTSRSRRAELVDLVAHEAYPGHHTEHAWKEHLLVDAGVVEESLVLVPTPQSLVSEGIAETAWELVESETRDAVAAALAAAGVRVRRGARRRGGRRADAAPVRRAQRGADAPRGRGLAGGGRGVHRALGGAHAGVRASRPCGSCSTPSGARTPPPTRSAATSAGGTSAGARSGTERCSPSTTRVADMLPVSSAP